MKPLEMYFVLKRFDFRCSLTDSGEYHIEHWIPVSKGGKTTIRNCYPLDATLNMRKGQQNPFEFFERADVANLYDHARFNALVFWLAVMNDMTVEEFRTYTFEQYEKGQFE